jgi:pimeloyl-ACP methyl ester carboxylesterase
MYTEVYGSGPPLLMIHGNGGSMQSFKKIVPYFALQLGAVISVLSVEV